MCMKWIVEKAGLHDAESIAQFQVDMAAESEGTVLSKEIVLKGVTEGLKDEAKGTYIVARNQQGKAVASLLLTREWSDWNCAWYWWIQSVFVSPEYRRKGVYRSMYEKVKEMAKKVGVSCIRLYVDKTNKKGLATYNSLGMKESHYLLYEENIKTNDISDAKECNSPNESLSDYELYCKQQADAFMDEIGDDRCFGDMAEGLFVRGH